MDIYSLGVMFYEMMTGGRPQVFNPLTGQQFNVPSSPTKNHSTVRPALDTAILRMMAYDLRNRYQTVGQLKSDLLTIYRSM